MARRSSVIVGNCSRNAESFSPELFANVNEYPPVDEMGELKIPTKPLSLYAVVDSNDEGESEKRQEKEVEYEEALCKAVFVVIADFKVRGYRGAARLSASLINWEEIQQRENECEESRKTVLRFMYEHDRAGTLEASENEILARWKATLELRRRLTTLKASYAQRVFDIYYKIRSTKRLLVKVAHVGRNFDSAER